MVYIEVEVVHALVFLVWIRIRVVIFAFICRCCFIGTQSNLSLYIFDNHCKMQWAKYVTSEGLAVLVKHVV